MKNNSDSFNKLKERKRDKQKFFKIKYLNRILLIITLALGVYYILATNNLSIKSFELNELKNEADYLSIENNEFKVKIISLESYDNLSKRIESLHMVKAGEVAYITAGQPTVAKK